MSITSTTMSVVTTKNSDNIIINDQDEQNTKEGKQKNYKILSSTHTQLLSLFFRFMCRMPNVRSKNLKKKKFCLQQNWFAKILLRFY